MAVIFLSFGIILQAILKRVLTRPITQMVKTADGIVKGDSFLIEKSWLTLVDLPLERLADRVIEEISVGNERSRQFLFYFLQPEKFMNCDHKIKYLIE